MESKVIVSYDAYDEIIDGNTVDELYTDFQLELYADYGQVDLNKIGIDINPKGRDFINYLKSSSRKLKESFFLAIFEDVIKTSDKPYFIEKQIKKIERIIERIKIKYPYYEFFAEDLEELTKDLQHEPASLNPLQVQDNHEMGSDINANKHFPKIKWKGKTNVLVTLFYDLLNGQDNKEQLIEAQKKDIKNLLIQNFTDADGNPFSESTIDTILSTTKTDKRANKGDRIELGNVRVK